MVREGESGAFRQPPTTLPWGRLCCPHKAPAWILTLHPPLPGVWGPRDRQSGASSAPGLPVTQTLTSRPVSAGWTQAQHDGGSVQFVSNPLYFRRSMLICTGQSARELHTHSTAGRAPALSHCTQGVRNHCLVCHFFCQQLAQCWAAWGLQRADSELAGLGVGLFLGPDLLVTPGKVA